jgi:hypothetical protein
MKEKVTIALWQLLLALVFVCAASVLVTVLLLGVGK